MLLAHKDSIRIRSRVRALHRFERVVVDTVDEALAVHEALRSDPLFPYVVVEPAQEGPDAYALQVRMSVHEAAKLRGIHTFDTALPEEWVRKVRVRSGLNPAGNVVWSYDVNTLFGAPAAVTPTGDTILSVLSAYVA